MPNQVQRLFRAQQLHDRKQYDARLAATPEARAKLPYTDYLRPIIADGDTGCAALKQLATKYSIFVQTRWSLCSHEAYEALRRGCMFADLTNEDVYLTALQGAAGIHFEDQLHGGKKCGHLAGKVIVPTSTHIQRFTAARFQLDMLQNTMLLIARTDAESGRLLTSTVDPRDHPFVKGVPTRMPSGERRLALADVLARAEAAGKTGPEIDKLEADWLAGVELLTFDQSKCS